MPPDPPGYVLREHSTAFHILLFFTCYAAFPVADDGIYVKLSYCVISGPWRTAKRRTPSRTRTTISNPTALRILSACQRSRERYVNGSRRMVVCRRHTECSKLHLMLTCHLWWPIRWSMGRRRRLCQRSLFISPFLCHVTSQSSHRLRSYDMYIHVYILTITMLKYGSAGSRTRLVNTRI